MQAIQFPAAGRLALTTLPDPVCGPDEVILEVTQAGICGTDLHIYHGEYMATYPLVPGHEFSGRVVERGAAVDYLHPGDWVAPDPNIFCGHCDYCRNEQANHCRNWQGVGITRPGGFARYVAVPARNCYPLPAELSPVQAAFVEPLACVAYALRRLRVWPGDRVLIFGAGPMGLLLLQALRHSGASTVTMVDKQTERLALAQQLGAAATFTAAETTALQDAAGDGFDIVIDATGVPAVIEAAFNYLRPRGQFLQFGVTPTDATVQINPYLFFKNDWVLLGSFALCYSFQPAIAWLASGVIAVEPLLSHQVNFADFAAAFALFDQGQTLKVQLVP